MGHLPKLCVELPLDKGTLTALWARNKSKKLWESFVGETPDCESFTMTCSFSVDIGFCALVAIYDGPLMAIRPLSVIGTGDS